MISSRALAYVSRHGKEESSSTPVVGLVFIDVVVPLIMGNVVIGLVVFVLLIIGNVFTGLVQLIISNVVVVALVFDSYLVVAIRLIVVLIFIGLVAVLPFFSLLAAFIIVSVVVVGLVDSKQWIDERGNRQQRPREP